MSSTIILESSGILGKWRRQEKIQNEVSKQRGLNIKVMFKIGALYELFGHCVGSHALPAVVFLAAPYGWKARMCTLSHHLDQAGQWAFFILLSHPLFKILKELCFTVYYTVWYTLPRPQQLLVGILEIITCSHYSMQKNWLNSIRQ